MVAKIDINSLVPLKPAPDYDKSVLKPLYANQAVEAEQAKVAAQEEATKAAQAAQAVQQARQLAETREVQPPQASSGDVQNLITKWASYYGVNTDWMLGVARCESGYNPSAVNHGYYAGGGNPTGLFQFLPETFTANAARAGLGNPNIWNADDSAHVAAYMFSIGQSGQWECK